jgi:hypothetical protein
MLCKPHWVGHGAFQILRVSRTCHHHLLSEQVGSTLMQISTLSGQQTAVQQRRCVGMEEVTRGGTRLLRTKEWSVKKVALAIGRALAGTGVRSTKVTTRLPRLSCQVSLWAFLQSRSLPSKLHSVKQVFFGQQQYPLASCTHSHRVCFPSQCVKLKGAGPLRRGPIASRVACVAYNMHTRHRHTVYSVSQTMVALNCLDFCGTFAQRGVQGHAISRMQKGRNGSRVSLRVRNMPAADTVPTAWQQQGTALGY